ncbi:hypothetical protein KCP76_19565 [Salmonella enterica subsp. enterica serovar Weltevreden]|nr:hypothetical protein KCP76_19565 [Salmonella enterica subsp. enterica serovar Weltevreden]
MKERNTNTYKNRRPLRFATYGELFSITRRHHHHDDMNMLTDVPMKLGRAAKATIADSVYDVLISKPQKLSSDNVVASTTKHANVLKSRYDVASPIKARQLMRMQKEAIATSTSVRHLVLEKRRRR